MSLEQMYLETINNLGDGVYFVDTDRRITFWNKAAEDLTGYKKEEIHGKCCQSNLLNHIDGEGRPLCDIGCPLYATICDGTKRTDEVFLKHKDGHRIPIKVSIFPIVEENKVVGAIEIFSPKSPVVYEDKLIERLSDLAMNDQLTGLANRRKIESYLEYNFNEMKRFHNKFCVVFLDIDNFGLFNNTYGHDTGDEVLRGVAKSVRHIIRKNDLFGRWGGEEFIGIFAINNDSEAVLIAEKVRILVANTEIAYGDTRLSVTASLGVAIADADDTICSLLTRADTLMYQSKHKGKNCVSADTAAAAAGIVPERAYAPGLTPLLAL